MNTTNCNCKGLAVKLPTFSLLKTVDQIIALTMTENVLTPILTIMFCETKQKNGTVKPKKTAKWQSDTYQQ